MYANQYVSRRFQSFTAFVAYTKLIIAGIVRKFCLLNPVYDIIYVVYVIVSNWIRIRIANYSFKRYESCRAYQHNNQRISLYIYTVNIIMLKSFQLMKEELEIVSTRGSFRPINLPFARSRAQITRKVVLPKFTAAEKRRLNFKLTLINS